MSKLRYNVVQITVTGVPRVIAAFACKEDAETWCDMYNDDSYDAFTHQLSIQSKTQVPPGVDSVSAFEAHKVIVGILKKISESTFLPCYVAESVAD